MSIGNGALASVLNDREGALFFASGISDSSCTDEVKFKREFDLMRSQPDLCCFYFSTIILENDTPYNLHKRSMEEGIKAKFKNYNIIRLGNIDWGTNPNTFLNALRNKKLKNNL